MAKKGVIERVKTQNLRELEGQVKINVIVSWLNEDNGKVQ